MSTLVEVLNEVRRSVRVEWLTPAQREAHDALVERARMYSPAVLIGPPGSGKTLVGWLIQRRLGFGHTAHPLQLPIAGGSPLGVVIDNADLAHVGARALFGQAGLKGWTTTVVLARAISSEGLPALHLPALTESEIAACLANLPVPLRRNVMTGERDLWQAVRTRLDELTLEEHHER